MGGLDDRADRRRVGSGPLQPLQSRVDFGDTIRQSRQFATTVLLQVRVRRLSGLQRPQAFSTSLRFRGVSHLFNLSAQAANVLEQMSRVRLPPGRRGDRRFGGRRLSWNRGLHPRASLYRGSHAGVAAHRQARKAPADNGHGQRGPELSSQRVSFGGELIRKPRPEIR